MRGDFQAEITQIGMNRLARTNGSKQERRISIVSCAALFLAATFSR
jgi:hypothetical protein